MTFHCLSNLEKLARVFYNAFSLVWPQNMVFGNIFQKSALITDPLLRNLRITPLADRWAFQVAVVLRRCDLKTAPALLREKFQVLSHGHNTRGTAKGNFLPLRPSSLSGTVCFSNRGPLLWNALPTELWFASSLSSFRKLFLSLLISSDNLHCLALGSVNP